MYPCMDSVGTIKKDSFLRLIVFTIVKITSTNKEIMYELKQYPNSYIL
jgi:hypothetical protein